MTISDLKASLPYLFKAELTGFIWGQAGLGKTSVVKQYAQEMGYKFFALYLGTQSDLGDVLGLAEFIDNGDGSKSTAFATPKWLQDTITYCNENPDSGAIIFLDEFNRARRDILSGMFSLALDKTFHTIRLPKNCHLIAAGNPPTDDYVVTDIDETALMSRFCHIKLEPSFEEWMTFAKGNLDATLVDFLKEQPELLEEKRVSFELPVKVDRRAYSRVDALFKVGTPMHLLEQLMYGMIGIDRTVAYKQFLKKTSKPLTGDDVLKGKDFETVTKWSDPTNIAASLLGITCDNLADKLQELDKAEKSLSNKQQNNLMKFLNILPKDVAYALFSKLMFKYELKNFKEFYSNPDFETQLVEIVKQAKGMEKTAETNTEAK